MNIETQLLGLCYKKTQPGVWIKPVGASLFMYEEDRKEWTNWVIGVNDQVLRYHAEVFQETTEEDQYKLPTQKDNEQLKNWIVYQETWTRINVGKGGDFSVLSREESFELQLSGVL